MFTKGPKTEHERRVAPATAKRRPRAKPPELPKLGKSDGGGPAGLPSQTSFEAITATLTANTLTAITERCLADEFARANAFARFDANLQRAFYDLLPKLKRAYGQPARNEAERHFQDALALRAVANFLDRVGPVYLADVADQFSRRATTLYDEGNRLLAASSATRSDPTLVRLARAHVVLAVDTMHWVIDPKRGVNHSRESAAEWAAKLRPQLRRLITESGTHRSCDLETAIVSWCKDFSRHDGVKNAVAAEVYSDGLAELKRWAPTRNAEEIERRAVWLLDRALLPLS